MNETIIKKVITTSWDDGHPLDFRVADLLNKYDLKGTFYIPKYNLQNTVMTEKEVANLAGQYEIGGHTLNHINLVKLNNRVAGEEIRGCHDWLTAVTGKQPASFCPPFGAYNDEIINTVTQTGFSFIRTTQLLTTDAIYPLGHTTLQLYEHSSLTYFKHLSVRLRIKDLACWLSKGSVSDLFKLTDLYLDRIEKEGGVFHLWGHSWEIEKFQLWDKLELLLKHITHRSGYTYIENKQLTYLTV